MDPNGNFINQGVTSGGADVSGGFFGGGGTSGGADASGGFFGGGVTSGGTTSIVIGSSVAQIIQADKETFAKFNAAKDAYNKAVKTASDLKKVYDGASTQVTNAKTAYDAAVKKLADTTTAYNDASKAYNDARTAYYRQSFWTRNPSDMIRHQNTMNSISVTMPGINGDIQFKKMQYDMATKAASDIKTAYDNAVKAETEAKANLDKLSNNNTTGTTKTGFTTQEYASYEENTFDDYMFQFFIGSVSVVGLFVLFRIIQKSK